MNLSVFCMSGACFGFLSDAAVDEDLTLLLLELELELVALAPLMVGTGLTAARSPGLMGKATGNPVPCLACCRATLRGGFATVSTYASFVCRTGVALAMEAEMVAVKDLNFSSRSSYFFRYTSRQVSPSSGTEPLKSLMQWACHSSSDSSKR
uniref:Uncharacterized protein n=1 Tax=Ixodes ricinus TaxID=34613 RepID=A0A6B0UW66_IXORI